MRWSYLNLDDEANVIQGFKDGACFDEIRRRLGYRFELASATYSSSVRRGSTLQLDFDVTTRWIRVEVQRASVFAVFGNGSSAFLPTSERGTRPLDTM